MGQNKEYVFHSPAGGQAGNGYRATAGGHIDEYGNLWVSVSLCSPEDNFNKQIGRNKAVGRSYKRNTMFNKQLCYVGGKEIKFIIYCLREAARLSEEYQTANLMLIRSLNEERLVTGWHEGTTISVSSLKKESLK